jgi:hypothetical protein
MIRLVGKDFSAFQNPQKQPCGQWFLLGLHISSESDDAVEELRYLGRAGLALGNR